jgi:hypothetical protein
VNPAAGHERDEIVLDRLGVVLAREGCRRLAGARQADDEERLLAVRCRDHLAAGVEAEAAAVEDDLVPHPETALLRLAEVVGVEDARDAVFEIHGDEAVARVARRLEVGRVDDRDGRLMVGRLALMEVEEILRAGDVRVARFDHEPRRNAEGRIVADEAVDDDHVLVADVVLLQLGDPRILLAADRLVARMRVGAVRGDEGGLRTS